MSAEHNHEPRCCCGPAKADPCPACPQHGTLAEPRLTSGRAQFSREHWEQERALVIDRPIDPQDPGGPQEPALHIDATPYTEQETAK